MQNNKTTIIDPAKGEKPVYFLENHDEFTMEMVHQQNKELMKENKELREKADYWMGKAVERYQSQEEQWKTLRSKLDQTLDLIEIDAEYV